tara:strand:+ start:731 stop:904 length:174 start_codon:yes stop_codon:yes gene_type:complete
MSTTNKVTPAKLAKYWQNGINKVTGWPDVKMKTPASYDCTLKVLKPNASNVFTTNHN